MASKFKSFTVCTPVGRVIYPHLQEAKHSAKFNKTSYECTILIPKTKDISRVTDAIAAAEEDFLAINKKRGKNFKYAVLKDGDEIYNEKVEDGEGKEDQNYKGNWVIAARTKDRPECFTADKEPIEIPLIKETIYAGCWAQMIINIAAFDGEGTGITCYLNGVRKIKDDQPLKRAVVDMFIDVDDETPTPKAAKAPGRAKPAPVVEEEDEEPSIEDLMGE